MREVKYRAWYNGKMYEVAKLDLWGDPDQATCDLASLDFDEEELFDIYLHEVKIMQFTGQNDKNGIEIYEGDILQDKRKRKFIVTWNNDIGNWVNKPTDNGTSYSCFNIGTVKGLEVVGNIYETPELIESEDKLKE